MGMDFLTAFPTTNDPSSFRHTLQPANIEKFHNEKYVLHPIQINNDANKTKHSHTYLLIHRSPLPSHRGGVENKQQCCEMPNYHFGQALGLVAPLSKAH